MSHNKVPAAPKWSRRHRAQCFQRFCLKTQPRFPMLGRVLGPCSIKVCASVCHSSPTPDSQSPFCVPSHGRVRAGIQAEPFSFIPYNNLWARRDYYCPQYTDMETEAQGD